MYVIAYNNNKVVMELEKTTTSIRTTATTRNMLNVYKNMVGASNVDRAIQDAIKIAVQQMPEDQQQAFLTMVKMKNK